MSYLDPPEEQEFIGCPLCGAHEAQLIETENGDFICEVCGTSQEWAWENLNQYRPIWDIEQADFEWEDLSETELIELAQIHEESETQHFKELGWMDENGELTDAYFRESDFAYNVTRERRY